MAPESQRLRAPRHSCPKALWRPRKSDIWHLHVAGSMWQCTAVTVREGIRAIGPSAPKAPTS
eukprot:4038895-Pyramimonas_sp.AAC.1